MSRVDRLCCGRFKPITSSPCFRCRRPLERYRGLVGVAAALLSILGYYDTESRTMISCRTSAMIRHAWVHIRHWYLSTARLEQPARSQRTGIWWVRDGTPDERTD
jgi:hypothetical protein